jgi:glycosyltransferase involved in cell wall biosynthesis
MFFTIERQLERVTDCLMFVSGYEQQTYHDKIGTPRCPFRLIYNGVSEAEFEAVETVDNPADFLFIGMMRDLKGPDIFLEALEAAARSTGKRLTAHMVGDGPDKPALVAQASAEGFPAHIDFHEPMPAREAFAMADTVVIPSRAEAMPYIVLEGLAGGKPMIASRVGGIPEVFGEQSIALIEPTVASLTAKMIEVLTAPGPFREAMPDRQWLHDRFSVVAMSDGVETAYSDAISRQI